MEDQDASKLQSDTWNAITREKVEQKRSHNHEEAGSKAAQRWKHVANWVRSRSKRHYQDKFRVTNREHMSGVDCFDGEKVRIGKTGRLYGGNGDLIVVNPILDGRLKDKAMSG